MKQTLIISLLLILFSVTNAQDLIVTDENDSLNCKITKKTSDFIYFTFKHENDVRNTLLPVSDIKDYEKDYYDQAEVTVNKNVKLDDYKKWRFDFNLGYSYRLAKIPDEMGEMEKDYIRKLKSGFSYGGDIIYFWSEQVGVGLKANIFTSSNSADESEVDFKSTYDGSGVFSDDITIFFIGPEYALRYYDKHRVNSLHINVAAGYMSYENVATLLSQQLTISSDCFGAVLDIGYDFAIDENWSLGIQASYAAGLLTKLTLEDATSSETIELPEEQYEGLHRVDILAGLRFSF